MRVVQIPKGAGKFRTIYVPSDEEMAKLKALVPELTGISQACDTLGVCHAFMPGRSPLTNAMQHRGRRYTMSFDLKDFFDSVTQAKFFEALTFKRVYSSVQDRKWDDAFVRDKSLTDYPRSRFYELQSYARQGLPTSPMVANIAACLMDERIVSLSRQSGRFDNFFVYTRYADDLTFSFDEMRIARMLQERVPQIVAQHGFVLNERKTRLQCAAAGRRIITGIAVDDECHPTREIKRRLRAAKHKNNRPQVHGLSEWCRLRLPKAYAAELVKQSARKVVSKFWQSPLQPQAAQKQSVLSSAISAVSSGVRRLFDL